MNRGLKATAIVLMLVAAVMWMYALWGASNSRFIEDTPDLILMVMGGPLGMIAGALVLSEHTS